MRRRYIQDRETGKLVEAKLYRRERHFIQGEIEPFTSMITGEVIATRRELREHNKRNNVTQDTFEGARAEREKEREAFFSTEQSYDSQRRKAAINFAFESLRGTKTKAELKAMAERYAKDN